MTALALETVAPLSVPERESLAELEAVIERGLATFVDVGTALMAVRDSRLYRALFPTFEDYCRERWSMSDRRARQLMGAAEVVREIGTIVPVAPATESQARPLTRLPAPRQREAWQEVVETAPEGKVTAAHVESVVQAIEGKHNHRAQGTGDNEWYTPVRYVEAARQVLGEIDLDPASSETADKTVQASQFFDKDDDGLTREWNGRVWLNPPYAQPAIQQFIEKVAKEYRAGRVSEAIILTHNYTDTAWFHAASSIASAICFTRGRIGFVAPDGTKAMPTQGQAFFYAGDNADKFAEIFRQFGLVVRPV